MASETTESKLRAEIADLKNAQAQLLSEVESLARRIITAVETPSLPSSLLGPPIDADDRGGEARDEEIGKHGNIPRTEGAALQAPIPPSSPSQRANFTSRIVLT